jgi:hypothetical protein
LADRDEAVAVSQFRQQYAVQEEPTVDSVCPRSHHCGLFVPQVLDLFQGDFSRVGDSASNFELHYGALSLRPSSSCLRLLPRRPFNLCGLLFPSTFFTRSVY